MGVAMLPRLAATVCNTTTGMARSFRPQRSRARRAKGTKVIRATSLVMIMLVKKHSSTSVSASWRLLWTLPKSLSVSRSNSPARWNPRTSSISENNSPSTRRSI